MTEHTPTHIATHHYPFKLPPRQLYSMGACPDLRGHEFGLLTVFGRAYRRQNKEYKMAWVTRCRCGRALWADSSALIHGITWHCGCMNNVVNNPAVISPEELARVLFLPFEPVPDYPDFVRPVPSALQRARRRRTRTLPKPAPPSSSFPTTGSPAPAPTTTTTNNGLVNAVSEIAKASNHVASALSEPTLIAPLSTLSTRSTTTTTITLPASVAGEQITITVTLVRTTSEVDDGPQQGK